MEKQQRLIDADALTRRVLKEKRFVFTTHDLLNNEYVVQTVYKDLAEFINEAPTIDAEPVRHGYWKKEFWTIERQRVCSVCIRTVRQPAYDNGDAYLFKYCPYCGAKMDGGAEDN